MEKADASLTNLQARELRDTLRQLEARRIQAILTDSYELRDGCLASGLVTGYSDQIPLNDASAVRWPVISVQRAVTDNHCAMFNIAI